MDGSGVQMLLIMCMLCPSLIILLVRYMRISRVCVVVVLCCLELVWNLCSTFLLTSFVNFLCLESNGLYGQCCDASWTSCIIGIV